MSYRDYFSVMILYYIFLDPILYIHKFTLANHHFNTKSIAKSTNIRSKYTIIQQSDSLVSLQDYSWRTYSVKSFIKSTKNNVTCSLSPDTFLEHAYCKAFGKPASLTRFTPFFVNLAVFVCWAGVLDVSLNKQHKRIY